MNGGRPRHSKAALGSLCGLWSTLLATAVLAAPPTGRGVVQSMSGGESNAERANPFRAVNHSFPANLPSPNAFSRLDLRAPASLPAPAAMEERSVATPDSSTAAFPSSRRPNEDVVRAHLQEDLPALGNDAAGARIPSRAQQLAQRFRREGLPVARLFGSRTALVSLGLNQRGKPGIWLIQKIP